MTHLRLDRKHLDHQAWEHLFFIALPPARHLAWYSAAPAARDIFPSPSDRAPRLGGARMEGKRLMIVSCVLAATSSSH